MIRAEFVEALQKVGVWEEEWGFVIYRTTFGDDDAWIQFQEAFSQPINDYFAEARNTYSNINEISTAQRFWKCKFVEDRDLEHATKERIYA